MIEELEILRKKEDGGTLNVREGVQSNSFKLEASLQLSLLMLLYILPPYRNTVT